MISKKLGLNLDFEEFSKHMFPEKEEKREKQRQ